jgi:hypothetical protein
VKPNRSRRSKAYDESQAYAHEALKALFKQTKTQFGNEAKGF